MADWTIRDYEPADEACCVSMWLKSYARSLEIYDLGYRLGHFDKDPVTGELSRRTNASRLRLTPEELESNSMQYGLYWRLHHPIVEALVRRCEIRLACDPERATASGDQPAVIWGWVCSSPGMVHWVGIKRDVARHGFAKDLVQDLLGPMAAESRRMTFDLTELRDRGLMPEAWVRDRGWLGSLRMLTELFRNRDEAFNETAESIIRYWQERRTPRRWAA